MAISPDEMADVKAMVDRWVEYSECREVGCARNLHRMARYARALEAEVERLRALLSGEAKSAAWGILRAERDELARKLADAVDKFLAALEASPATPQAQPTDGIDLRQLARRLAEECYEFCASPFPRSDTASAAGFVNDLYTKLLVILDERIGNARFPSPSDGWRFDMQNAPKDGTDLLIIFRHENFKYAKSDAERDRWQEVCVARWIVNGDAAGWTWHGICGIATAWRPLPAPPTEGRR